jgi:hypothetical protein
MIPSAYTRIAALSHDPVLKNGVTWLVLMYFIGTLLLLLFSSFTSCYMN